MAESVNLNPQRDQMADESMVRTLSYQAKAIWPQEALLFDRYKLPDPPRIVDVGCGTGEASRRLAELYPMAEIVGVDILESSLEIAYERLPASMASRVRFETGDAHTLHLPDDAFDLAVCRHMLQSVPYPDRVVDQLCRVVRPGGYLHLLVEDYAMLHFYPTNTDTDLFWQRGPIKYGEAIGTNLRVGRTVWSLLKSRNLSELDVTYVVVDTIRVGRAVFAGVLEAWRDGFSDAIAANSDLTRAEIDQSFEEIIECVRGDNGYGVWFIPIVSGRVNGP